MRGYNKDYAAKNNVEAPFKEGDLMYGAAVLGNFTNVAGFIKENNDNKDGAIKVVRDYYVQLPAMWRESEYIIKLLFKTKEEVDNTVYDFEDGPGKVSGYEYLSQYIKSIPNAELVKDLKEYLDDNKEAEFDSLYYGLDKTVAMHYMTKELNDKNNDNGKVERKGKSLKI